MKESRWSIRIGNTKNAMVDGYSSPDVQRSVWARGKRGEGGCVKYYGYSQQVEINMEMLTERCHQLGAAILELMGSGTPSNDVSIYYLFCDGFDDLRRKVPSSWKTTGTCTTPSQ